jgi:tRNA A-37 threonylcarbamoyl transferase component Bud32
VTEPTAELPSGEPELAAGEVIGEYEIAGKVGQGGFGTVYKAVHPLIGKQVAIKVLARKFSADPEMVSRFIAEARAVNQIRNRYIIDIFSFGQLADHRHYYVMEFLDGEALDARLERGRLELAAALPILRAIGKALDAAHAKGIAHRDLKPENVFLVHGEDDVWPKLLDFGVAKLMGEVDGTKHKTRTGIPIGTPYYMSPEQCRGKDVDHRTDYYAFGVLAYELLTGTHPIDGDDYMDIMMKQLSFEPPPPSSVAPELPAGVDDAIAWLMRKDREQRPPSLATAVRALEQAAGLPSAPATGVVEVPKLVTPVPGSMTSPSVATGLAQTQPGLVAAAPKPRRWPIVVGAVAAIGAAAVVVFAMRGSPQPAPTLVHDDIAKPQPATPKPAPAPQPPPVAKSPAIVTVTGAPAGTDVSIAGASIGVAPGPVQVARDDSQVVLTFKAAGYQPASRAITPDRDQQLDVQLHKIHHATPAAAPNKDSILDPFGAR